MATIGTICERDVICTGRETTVQAAAKLMRRYRVGTLVIAAGKKGRRTKRCKRTLSKERNIWRNL